MSPDKKSIPKKKHGVRSFQKQDYKNADGLGALARKKLKEAFENPVVFEHFSVDENITNLLQRKQPSAVTNLQYMLTWDGSEPKVAVDRNGIPIIVYLPELFSEMNNAHVCDTMIRFHGNNASLVEPKASGANARNKLSNFQQNPTDSGNSMIGVVEMGILVEQGQSHQEPRASAAHFANTVTSVAERTSLNQCFNFCRHVENIVLSYTDPEWYSALMSIRGGLFESNTANQMVHGIDPSHWPAHTITWDRHIDCHFDTKDHPRGWSSLSVYGDFNIGGYLGIPTLGLRIRFRPKDLVHIRGTMLKHEITEFRGGHRFAHTSYFPFSMEGHYEHLLHKPVSSMPFAKADEILQVLIEQTHRVRRRKLDALLSLKRPKPRIFLSRVEMKMNRNQEIFTEQQRRQNQHRGKGRGQNGREKHQKTLEVPSKFSNIGIY